jgi:tight adherence protein C
MDTNYLLLGALSALALGLIVYGLLPKRKNDVDAIRRRLSGRRGLDEEADIRTRAKEAATEQLVRRAAPMLSRLVMPSSDQEQSTLRLRLASAGYRQPYAQSVFMSSKSILAVLGLIVGLTVAYTQHMQPGMLVGVAAGAAGLGMMLPNFWLSSAVGGRQQKIRYGLPDTLDLLVVSVEAGLGLDAALKRVGDEMAQVHPELSEEMRIATMETQMGRRRGEALENMARRTAIDEIRSLVSVVVQAEKFGTSIARALRNQADTMRVKRRLAAEERAQKTAVKLMIPLVLFIFPAMGVVLAGPAIISTMRTFEGK